MKNHGLVISILNSLFILYLISILIILLTNVVSANTTPMIDSDNIGLIIALTILVNIPINFIIFYFLLLISHSIKSNRVYIIKPKDFVTAFILVTILLSVLGAFIDFVVLTSFNTKIGTYELNFNPLLISIGLIMIWLSFFLPTWTILKQKIPTSIIISTGITLINFISWSAIIAIGMTVSCIFIMIPTLILFFVLIMNLFNWYTTQYKNYHNLKS